MIMPDRSANNNRIAKNTVLLYVRMMVTTVVSLFTARLTLRLLGVEDYGIYNVIGGIIGFMSILTATMTSATQRFLSFDLGKGDLSQYKKNYSMLLNIFMIFSMIVVVLMELVGPYFIRHYLVIPPERMFAAQLCFQFTIINFVLATVNIPQNASIVAYEKMGIYAYFTFLDIFTKLAAVLVLYITPVDRLVSFAALTCLMTLVTNAIIYIYCNRKLEGCQYVKYWDSTQFKKLASYAGWNLFGSTSSVLATHGQSILLNMFFGPVVNAAKGIADRIYGIVYSFSSNFYMAVTPQIIKTYAAGETDYTKNLVLTSSKYSYYLLGIIVFPLMFNMKPVLEVWLGKDMVSLEMILFAKLELAKSLIFVLEPPITMAVRATGDIKKYQICVGINTLMFLPICYVAFICGLPAYSSVIILGLIYFYVQFIRVWLVRKVINVNMKEYFQKVMSPLFYTTALICALALAISRFGGETLAMVIARITAIFIISMACFYLLGLSRNERSYAVGLVKSKLLKRNSV